MCLDKTCENQLSDTSSEEEDEDSESTNSEDVINNLQETFEDDSPLAINKIRNGLRGILEIIAHGQLLLISNMKREKVSLLLIQWRFSLLTEYRWEVGT